MEALKAGIATDASASSAPSSSSSSNSKMTASGSSTRSASRSSSSLLLTPPLGWQKSFSRKIRRADVFILPSSKALSASATGAFWRFSGSSASCAFDQVIWLTFTFSQSLIIIICQLLHQRVHYSRLIDDGGEIVDNVYGRILIGYGGILIFKTAKLQVRIRLLRLALLLAEQLHLIDELLREGEFHRGDLREQLLCPLGAVSRVAPLPNCLLKQQSSTDADDVVGSADAGPKLLLTQQVKSLDLVLLFLISHVVGSIDRPAPGPLQGIDDD
ncbi:hypothetical protein TYRP_009716 [Tyrophagus putrescentiae]|nr:hypothetical protein TYRP_009716 [Tyrophagus putrescentiae]